MRTLLVSTVLALTFIACGGDDGGSGGDDGGGDDGSGSGSAAVCTVTASLNSDTSARTMNGIGTAVCNQPALIEIETCVQMASTGSTAFTDIQCMSGTMSGVMENTVRNLSGCALGAGKDYRAKVNAKIDGAAQPEKLSASLTCEE